MVLIKMAVTIYLKDRLTYEQQAWLVKNVGHRLHYIVSRSIGGEGWVAKKELEESYAYVGSEQWTLTFEDDKIASWFMIMFPQ